jgi:hypothetical protein
LLMITGALVATACGEHSDRILGTRRSSTRRLLLSTLEA